MRPAAGVRDTLITFQTRAIVTDPDYGTTTEGAWSNLGTEWAEVRDMLPSRGERIADGIDITRRPVRVRTLYRSDVTAAMRIAIDGRAGFYRIVTEPAELGRRDGIEFVAERLSTAGDEP